MNKINYILVALFLFSQISVAQNLYLNLIVGDTYHQKSHNTSITSQDYFGSISESEMTLGGNMSFKVLSKNSTSYDLEVQFLTIFMSMISEGVEMNVSSEKSDTDNILDKMLKEMTKFSFNITMSKYGRVTEIQLNDFYEKISESLIEIPKIEKHRIIFQIKQSFGEKALKGSIEMITAVYPEEPIDETRQWTNEIRLETTMGSNMKNVYKLIDYNETYALIELNSQTKTDEDNSFIKLNDELTRFTMNGTMKSIIKVDSKTGWIISSDINQDFIGLRESKRNEDSQLVLKIPFTYKSNLKVTSD